MGARSPHEPLVKAAPFRRWIRERLAEAEAAEGIEAPASYVAGRVCRSTRWLWKWTSPRGEYARAQRAGWWAIAAALTDWGLDPGELYPEQVAAEQAARILERWCSSCREPVTTADDGVCPWCDSPTRASKPAGGRRPLLSDDELRVLHRLHVDRGQSIRGLAAMIWRRKGYASADAAAVSMGRGFRRLGLAARPRLEAVATAAARSAGGMQTNRRRAA